MHKRLILSVFLALAAFSAQAQSSGSGSKIGAKAKPKTAIAILYQGSREEMRAWLQKNKKNLDNPLDADLLPIMLVADRYYSYEAAEKQREFREFYDLCLKNMKTEEPWSAARMGDLPRLKKILSKNPSLANYKTAMGAYILLAAAYSGSVETVSYLLEQGADMDVLNPGGVSILHAGVRSGSLPMVKYLIDKGAAVFAFDHNTTTPRAWAEMMKFTEIEAYIGSLYPKQGLDTEKLGGGTGK